MVWLFLLAHNHFTTANVRKALHFFQRKWTFITALAIFEVGSVICGAAVNSSMLIIGRAVAGVGAAGLFSGGMIIVAHSVPLRKRPIYIGILASTWGIASVVGPLLGGVFTDRISWRWCFYINLPFGAVAIAVVSLVFTDPEQKGSKLSIRQKVAQMDLLGALFLISAIVCLLLALQWGGSTYAWADSRVWGCLLGFGLLTIVFIAIQIRRGDLATLPPRIVVRQRTVLASALFSTFLAMALFTHTYFLPFYFQAVRGYSAEASGIKMIPYLASIVVASIVSGFLITKFGNYVPLAWFGSAVFCTGSGLLFTLEVDSSTIIWVFYQLITGLGAGLCVQIPFIAVQVVLEKEDMPVGNATANFFNSFGGAIAISVAQAIFNNAFINNLHEKLPTIDPQTLISAGATRFREVVASSQLATILQVYNTAITSTFILAVACSGIAFVCSFLFEWKSVKGKRLDMSGGV